ncbi:hypothetical protein ACFXPX_02575 [Kitasatospora sp. NPDC059146]|uniref:hypothetical protein n=1 Tax=Kitasatospora sp. NPDC059146 TaxID=3346741 RepID=UPI0036CAFFD5
MASSRSLSRLVSCSMAVIAISRAGSRAGQACGPAAQARWALSPLRSSVPSVAGAAWELAAA